MPKPSAGGRYRYVIMLYNNQTWHKSLYNLRDSDLPGRRQGESVLRSVTQERLPPLSHAEQLAVKEAATATIASLCKSHFGQMAAAVWMAECSLVEAPLGRTLVLDLPEECDVDSDVVHALRVQVLASHPLWRVLLISGREDVLLEIYPAATHFVSPVPASSEDDALARFSFLRRKFDEATLGDQLRQRRLVSDYLVRIVTDAEATLGLDLVGVFGKYENDVSLTSIWVAYVRDTEDDDPVPISHPDAEAGEDLRVSADGLVTYHCFPQFAEAARASQWLFHKGQSPCQAVFERPRSRDRLIVPLEISGGWAGFR